MWNGYCWPVPARWRRIQTSEKDFILVRFSFCRHSSAAPHFPRSFVESVPHASEKTKQQKKKLIGWKGNIELFSGPLCGPLHYWSGFLSDSGRRSPLTLPRRTIFTRYSRRDGFIIRCLASHHLPSPSPSPPLLFSSLLASVVFASLFLTPRTCLTRDADGHVTLTR